MLSRIYLLVAALLLLPTLYIHFVYVARCTNPHAWRALTFLPAILMAAYFLWAKQYDDLLPSHQGIIGTFVFVLLLVTAPAVLFCLVDILNRLICWLIGLFAGGAVSQRPGRIIALTFTLIAAFILLHGFFIGSRHHVVHRQTLYFDNLPKQFDGYKLAFFSDLHIGTFRAGRQGDVEKIVKLINEEQCDIILFGGDLVNAHVGELDGFEEVLSQLSAPDGVVSVLGNHDYPSYGRFRTYTDKASHLLQLYARQKAFGWHLLRNDHLIIQKGGAQLAVVGVENDGNPPFPSLGDLPKATQGLRNVMMGKGGKTGDHVFTVLLSHDPTHWRRRVLEDTNIDLTLSGHTHASQFKVFGWSPVRWVYDEWSGPYVEGPQVLQVSDGVGEVLFPFRFGAWPEINVITLKRKQ